MAKVFRQATSFNSDLSRWNTSAVVDMSQMVRSTVVRCRQVEPCVGPLFAHLTIGSFSYSVHLQFMHAVNFNADISAWDVSRVRDASFALFGASSYKVRTLLSIRCNRNKQWIPLTVVFSSFFCL
jgi:surface protein